MLPRSSDQGEVDKLLTEIRRRRKERATATTPSDTTKQLPKTLPTFNLKEKEKEDSNVFDLGQLDVAVSATSACIFLLPLCSLFSLKHLSDAYSQR